MKQSKLRVYVDECVSPALARSLSTSLRGFDVRTPSEEALAGYKDVPLLAELNNRNFDIFITRDTNQLREPKERQAVIDSRLHWLGVSSSRDRRYHGEEGFMRLQVSLLWTLRYIRQELLTEPHAFSVRPAQKPRGIEINMERLN